MKTEITSLEKRIKAIEDRNSRVEIDKDWETSLERKILMALLTYAFFVLTVGENPLINAILPTIGFLLSTLSLSYFKRLWIHLRRKRN